MVLLLSPSRTYRNDFFCFFGRRISSLVINKTQIKISSNEFLFSFVCSCSVGCGDTRLNIDYGFSYYFFFFFSVLFCLASRFYSRHSHESFSGFSLFMLKAWSDFNWKRSRRYEAKNRKKFAFYFYFGVDFYLLLLIHSVVRFLFSSFALISLH